MDLPVAPLSARLFPLASPRSRRLQRDAGDAAHTAPLFEGIGTHYMFLYVGTPPQRVSVIVDTGSHHTAFPCTGCSCGKHMNPFFDPKRSNSSVVCAGRSCRFSQSYSEGSSWEAFKVRDRVSVGGERGVLDAYLVPFDFGCQVRETGLFRTQHVDGIMGMSALPGTLPFQLFAARKTQTRAFSMCFRLGGGVLSLGGLNPAADPALLVFARARVLSSGWYSVRLKEILFETQGVLRSLGEEVRRANGGKGVIVDSGTTDTYLPYYLRGRFEALFESCSGLKYSTKRMALSDAQLLSLPTLVFRLEGAGQTDANVRVRPDAYLERLGQGVYAGRVFVTENSGAVLGANVMTGHEVVFDPDGARVGFAESACDLSESPRHARLQLAEAEAGPSASSVRPLGPCSARCEGNGSWHRAEGTQLWPAPHALATLTGAGEARPCSALCWRGALLPLPPAQNLTRGDPPCFPEAWSDCSSECSQTRSYASLSAGSCVRTEERRQCRVFRCPTRGGDVLLSMDLIIGGIERALWSFPLRERLQQALGTVLALPAEHIFVAASFEVARNERNYCVLAVRARLTELLGDQEERVRSGRRCFFAAVEAGFGDLLAAALAPDRDPLLAHYGWITGRQFRATGVTLQAMADRGAGRDRAIVASTLLDQKQVATTHDRLIYAAIVAIVAGVYCLFCFLTRFKKELKVSSSRLKY